MTINIELTEADLKALVIAHLRDKLDADLQEKDVHIETKSKQNYRAEWEEASYRARVVKTT